MDYKEFKLYSKDHLSVRLGKEVEIRTIVKNNSVSLDALMVCENSDSGITPTIYLDEYYQMYKNGVCFDDVIYAMRAFYEKHADPKIDVSCLKDFSGIKDRIIYRLISKTKNEDILKSVPYVPFMDLAVVFYVSFQSNEEFNAEMMINKGLQKLWNVTDEQLYYFADHNTAVIYPPVVETLQNCMRRLVPSEALPPFIDEVSGENDEIYVLTNMGGSHGATAILYEGVLCDFKAEHKGGYYLVPSSVHEWLLIPSSCCEAEYIDGMVREINGAYVSEEEILSDHVYPC